MSSAESTFCKNEENFANSCLFEIDFFPSCFYLEMSAIVFETFIVVWTLIDIIICILINDRAQRGAFILKFIHVFLYFGGSLIELSLKYVLVKGTYFLGLSGEP